MNYLSSGYGMVLDTMPDPNLTSQIYLVSLRSFMPVRLDGFSELLMVIYQEKFASKNGYKSSYGQGNGLFESLFIRILSDIERVESHGDDLLVYYCIKFYNNLVFYKDFDVRSFIYIFKHKEKIEKKIKKYYKQDLNNICTILRRKFGIDDCQTYENLEILFSSVVLYVYINNFIPYQE